MTSIEGLDDHRRLMSPQRLGLLNTEAQMTIYATESVSKPLSTLYRLVELPEQQRVVVLDEAEPADMR